MKTPQEVFAEYLQNENLKMTSQRQVIQDTILKQKGHLSAEELCIRVKKQDNSIGQATVYRTLKLLTDSGLIEPLDFADGVTRYEPRYGKSHHDHLICEQCGKNIEILDETIELRQEELAKEHGFTLSRHKMYLYGICADCRKQDIKNSKN
jgi:Fur family ferric uptake transcriptional regulator